VVDVVVERWKLHGRVGKCHLDKNENATQKLALFSKIGLVNKTDQSDR